MTDKQRNMEGKPLSSALSIAPGAVAVIGSGGKTALIALLASELAPHARVIVSTTTHIFPMEGMRTLDGESAAAVRAALDEGGAVCLGILGEDGKLTKPNMALDEMLSLADHVLIEADGSKGLPLKAHAAHEPVIPDNARVIGVIGADGFYKSIASAAHRPGLYAEALGVEPSHITTPYEAAMLANRHFPNGIMLVNKCDGEAGLQAAREFARAYSGETIAASLLRGGAVYKWRRNMLVLIRGAGDIATGVAIRLMRAGAGVILTETEAPTTIRRTVAFSEAVWAGSAEVEGAKARLASSSAEALRIAQGGEAAVLIDPELRYLNGIRPDALVDAVIAKRNTGTRITDAPIVIGLGPGFSAGEDCHAAIETMRGHDLGRVYYEGSPSPNTGVPGELGGHSADRLIRASANGVFAAHKSIGDAAEKGEKVAEVDGIPVYANVSGVVRGMLKSGTPVHMGMKSGDIDPRGNKEYCRTVSDKARALGGAVLEAIMHFRSGEWKQK